MGGFTGAMYQQFAITIVISVVISGFVALTLTPALCSIFIKKIEPKPFWFVKKFNDFFDKLTLMFTGGVSLIVRHSIIAIVIFATLLGITYQLFQKVPSSLVPLEDKGYLISATSLPPASSLQRTINVGKQMSDIAKNIPEIEDSVIISGFDIFTGASKTNASTSFFTLKPWSERLKEEQSADSISQILNGVFYEIPDATIFALSAPPIDGLSTSGGFEMYLQDKSGGSLEALNSVVNEIIEKASSRPELSMVRSSFDISIPQYHTILDKDKAKALGVSISDAYKTLQLTLGSYYVNDFNLYGRTYQVNVQSESKLREKPDDLNAIFVKSESGKLIPISSLITTKRSIGADTLDRFNGLSAAKIEGEPYVGEFAFIGENVKIGKGAKIYPHVYIGDNVQLGDNVTLFSGAKIHL
jgi:multidrug efflux pump